MISRRLRLIIWITHKEYTNIPPVSIKHFVRNCLFATFIPIERKSLVPNTCMSWPWEETEASRENLHTQENWKLHTERSTVGNQSSVLLHVRWWYKQVFCQMSILLAMVSEKIIPLYHMNTQTYFTSNLVCCVNISVMREAARRISQRYYCKMWTWVKITCWDFKAFPMNAWKLRLIGVSLVCRIHHYCKTIHLHMGSGNSIN